MLPEISRTNTFHINIRDFIKSNPRILKHLYYKTTHLSTQCPSFLIYNIVTHTKLFVVHKGEGEERERDKRMRERNGFYVSCKCSVENLVSDFTTRDASDGV